ncbi:HIT zinc finger protein [Diplocarpon rosae]|nr:HIT zinc finger protein [Diplocarpon rosae]
MINFGVREVAISKSSAPGWVLVPDTGANASVACLQPTSRKRARTQNIASSHETTARQDAKLVRELAALDRENYRDVSIPVPIRHRDNAGRVSHGKVTSAVRKILQSQKTFANYLSDFEALAQNSSGLPTVVAPSSTPAPSTTTPHLTSKGTRSHRKKDPTAVLMPTPLRRVSSVTSFTPAAIKSQPSTGDAPLPKAPVLSQGSSALPKPHPGDADALLMSRIPAIPSQAEIEKLLAAPPLTYNEARGPWVEEDMRKPVRQFCEICGYWGRVKCMRCGSKVCALECLTQHHVDCLTRYGA